MIAWFWWSPIEKVRAFAGPSTKPAHELQPEAVWSWAVIRTRRCHTTVLASGVNEYYEKLVNFQLRYWNPFATQAGGVVRDQGR